MTYLHGNLGWIPLAPVLQQVMEQRTTQKKLEHQEKLQEQQLSHEAALQVMGKEFQEKELASKIAISHRQDKLFKQLAIYVGLSLGVLILLISGGVTLIKRKGEK